jgi:hypothetical protein
MKAADVEDDVDPSAVEAQQEYKALLLELTCQGRLRHLLPSSQSCYWLESLSSTL